MRGRLPLHDQVLLAVDRDLAAEYLPRGAVALLDLGGAWISPSLTLPVPTAIPCPPAASPWRSGRVAGLVGLVDALDEHNVMERAQRRRRSVSHRVVEPWCG